MMTAADRSNRATSASSASRGRSRGRGLAGLVFSGLVFTGLVFTATLRAENRLSLSYAEAQPGDQGLRLLVKGRYDTEVHAFSLAVSYPAEVFRLRSFGVGGTHVQQYEPELVSPRIDHELGLATLGVIIDFDLDAEATPRSLPPVAEDEPDRILARIVLDVAADAPSGFHAIRLADGIGQPASFNRFSEAGTSVSPELESSGILVRGTDVISLDRAIAFAGATPNLPIFARARHADPLAGFSIAVRYDCTALTLNDAGLRGTDLSFLVRQIEFFQTDLDDTLDGPYCRSRTGVIFDYVSPFDGQSLRPTDEELPSQSLLQFRFRVNAGADSERQYQDLELHNETGPVVLNNTFIVDLESIDPYLEHGKIYFSQGCFRGQVLDRETGTPQRGVLVRTEPEGYEDRTNAFGIFEIQGAIPGEYSISLEREGFYDEFVRGLTVSGAGPCDDWGVLEIYRVPVASGIFRRGYVNDDSNSDISDAVWVLNWLFKGGRPPSCLAAADTNADNRVDISDTIYHLNFLFAGGPAPPPPTEECGPTTPGALACESTGACE